MLVHIRTYVVDGERIRGPRDRFISRMHVMLP